MKGLLYKDWITLLRQMKLYLLLIAAFALVPGRWFSSLAIVYAAMLPFSAIAYDERSKWNRLAVMMPYTDGQLVLCKYLLGWLGLLCAVLLTSVGQIAVCLARGASAELAGFPQSMLMIAIVSLILQALALPLMFRFGAERGRMLFLLLMVAGAASAWQIANAMIGDLSEGAARWIILSAALLAAAGSALSVRLSRHFFRRGLRA